MHPNLRNIPRVPILRSMQSVRNITFFISPGPKVRMIKEKDKLQGHRGTCWNVSWSPNSAFISSCGLDRFIKVWGRENSSFKCLSSSNDSSVVHTRAVRRTCWRPDSAVLACCSFDSTSSLWSLSSDNTLSLISKISGQESEIKGVCFSSCGEMLATSSRDKSIWIFDVSSLQSSPTPCSPEIRLNDEVTLPMSPLDREIDIECLAVLQGHSQDVKNVRFNPIDPHMMVSVSYDDSIKIWRSTSSDDWELSQTLKGHSNTVWDIVFNPCNPDEFATVSADGSLKIWFQPSRSSNLIRAGHSYLLSGPLGLSSRQFNHSLKPVGEHGWSCQTIQLTTSQIDGIDPAPVYCVDWSVNSLIAVGCGDNTIRIFMRNGNLTVPLTSVKTMYEPNSVSFNPRVTDVTELAVGFEDGSIIIYEIPCSDLLNS